MILGFLAKGGSGKSSVSSQMALYLNQEDKTVLAIDADHNMDLSYNLMGDDHAELNYYSSSLPDMLKHAELDETVKYDKAFLSSRGKKFTITPLSPPIEKYSFILPNGIRVMTAGPQTDNVLYGKACSHSLTTPLKILLPLLEEEDEEYVIVDEKAGADGVSTGIITGIDVGIIICEPALHSIKTAKQIAELMIFYKTPYLFVGNKITSSEDKDFIVEQLREEPAAFLLESKSIQRNPFAAVDEWHDELKTVTSKAKELNKNDRLERTIMKFKRNKDFSA